MEVQEELQDIKVSTDEVSKVEEIKVKKEINLDFLFIPVKLLSWLVALPIRFMAWMIDLLKTRNYDPEKVICPGCGYKGEKGSSWKTCRIEFKRTSGPERASLEHSCFRCGALFYSKLFTPVEKWFNPPQVDKVKDAARRLAI